MPQFLIETDDAPPVRVDVPTGPVRIGKHRDNELVLPSWRVARLHAEIVRIDGGWRLLDKGSIGGTWVNGERVVEYGPLAAADEIQIAGYRIRMEQGGAFDAGAAPDASASVVEDDGVVSGAVHADAASIDPLVEWRRAMHRRLLQAIDLRRRDVRQLSEHQLRAEARVLVVELLADEPDIPTDIDREKLVEDILAEAIGLGPLEALMADPGVSEIMVNSPADIFVERAGRLERVAMAFTGEPALRAVIDRIVAPLGRRVDEASPMVDARLPDGSRVNAIVPPLAVRGTALTIRRFGKRLLRPDDLVALGSASAQMLAFLRVCVAGRRNIVISGGTGSGKTTLLNLLSNLIDPTERIVTIEDAAELQLRHPNLVSLEARPANAEGRGAVAIRDLVRNALRMRPDRIVVGECRGGEALDMLQAMNTGHDGSLTTLHANAPRDVVSRLETMVLMSGVDLPVSAIRDQIASAVDVIVHQSRLADGSRRIVEIVEVTGVESGRIQMQSLFRYGRPGARVAGAADRGGFECCGVVPSFYEDAPPAGVAYDLSIFDHGGERDDR